MNTHVSHFEYLTYDIHDLQAQHNRVRRSSLSSGKNKPIQLRFDSHGRLILWLEFLAVFFDHLRSHYLVFLFLMLSYYKSVYVAKLDVSKCYY